MIDNLNELRGFLKLARAGSFTKAAAQLGVSQSALSHSIRGLEARLGLKLFHRTTRSVSPTEAGERLYARLSPLFDSIEHEIHDLLNAQGKLQGRLRINATEHAFSFVLWDKLQRFMAAHPEVSLELIADNRFIDIVAEGFDAGIRLGDDLAKDMIAVRVSPDIPTCTAASPDFLARHGIPSHPHELETLPCIAMRLPTHGGILPWEFTDPQDRRRKLMVQPQGRFIANHAKLLTRAACQGHGLIWMPRDVITAELADGRLQSVLDDWAIVFPGYHLYYANRRAGSPLLQALIAVLQTTPEASSPASR